tara:strand:- start:78 stop:734 length:657 start_codon:yes stop_codon:yes gene_type:complete
MATLGQDIPDIEITIPDSQVDRVEVVEIGDALEVAVLKKVSDLNAKVESDRTTAVVGKKVAKSSVTSKAKAGDESTVAFNTTKVNKTEIVVKGQGNGVVNVNTGRFNNSSIKFNKKSADSVSFNNGVEVRNATIDGGRGADTITFKENSVIKGSNEITLGQGADVLELPANKQGKGKIVVTDLSNNDTIKIGDESFSGRAVLDGDVELPSYIEIQGLD